MIKFGFLSMTSRVVYKQIPVYIRTLGAGTCQLWLLMRVYCWCVYMKYSTVYIIHLNEIPCVYYIHVHVMYCIIIIYMYCVCTCTVHTYCTCICIEIILYSTCTWNYQEPQLPKHECGLDVTFWVTRCAGRVSANTRPHQLSWGDSGSVGATWHAHAAQMAGLMMNGSQWWLDGSPLVHVVHWQ